MTTDDQQLAGTTATPIIDRLSTHVLDTTAGRPAAGIPATLEAVGLDGTPVARGSGVTDNDGRIQQINTGALAPGEYRLILSTAGYFGASHGATFYPSITIHFLLDGGRPHYHIAVLASTYSYATYLGS
jgi:5-hydroxyisourate hydrolase